MRAPLQPEDQSLLRRRLQGTVRERLRERHQEDAGPGPERLQIRELDYQGHLQGPEHRVPVWKLVTSK